MAEMRAEANPTSDTLALVLCVVWRAPTTAQIPEDHQTLCTRRGDRRNLDRPTLMISEPASYPNKLHIREYSWTGT